MTLRRRDRALIWVKSQDPAAVKLVAVSAVVALLVASAPAVFTAAYIRPQQCVVEQEIEAVDGQLAKQNDALGEILVAMKRQDALRAQSKALERKVEGQRPADLDHPRLSGRN